METTIREAGMNDNDIVVRLREPSPDPWQLRFDAADEIERLRAKLTAIQSQIVNLPRTGTADKIYTLAKIETE